MTDTATEQTTADDDPGTIPSAVVVPSVEYDHKGRALPQHMHDRELLIELVLHMRAVADTVEELSDSPMVAALKGGSNPLMAMFRS